MKSINFRGEKGISIQSESLRAIILPGRGGKIASLEWVEPRFGREEIEEKSQLDNQWLQLLIQPLGATLTPLTPGTFGFDQSWGWDDMFPCIAPGPYPFESFRNIILPDHGELWYLPAEVITNGNGVITMEFLGKILPYRMTKSIGVQGNILRLDWTLTNTSAVKLYYFWAAHPLFDVSEDCVFSGPGSVLSEGRTVINAFDQPTLPGYAKEYDYPIAQILEVSEGKKEKRITTKHLNQMPKKNQPGAMKYYFTHRVRDTELPLVIHQKTKGIELRLNYDLNFLPYLGMWINGNGRGEQYTMAPEPATGIMDSLHAASEYKTAACIQPHSVQHWWMELEVVST